MIDDAAAGKVKAQQTVIATARVVSDSDLSQAGSVHGDAGLHGARAGAGRDRALSTRAPTSSRLGSILCEVLTGQPAFVGRSAGEIHRKAALGDLAEALAALERLRRRRRADRPGQGLPGAEPEDRPRARRRGGRSDHGLPHGRAGEAAVGRDRPRHRADTCRRGGEAARAGRRAGARPRPAPLNRGARPSGRGQGEGRAAGAAADRRAGGVGAGAGGGLRRRLRLVPEPACRAAVARGPGTTRGGSPASPGRASRRRPGPLGEGRRCRSRRRTAHGRCPRRSDPSAASRPSWSRLRRPAPAGRSPTGSCSTMLIDIRSAKADDRWGSATDASYASAFREAGLDVTPAAGPSRGEDPRPAGRGRRDAGRGPGRLGGRAPQSQARSTGCGAPGPGGPGRRPGPMAQPPPRRPRHSPTNRFDCNRCNRWPAMPRPTSCPPSASICWGRPCSTRGIPEAAERRASPGPAPLSRATSG